MLRHWRADCYHPRVWITIPDKQSQTVGNPESISGKPRRTVRRTWVCFLSGYVVFFLCSPSLPFTRIAQPNLHLHLKQLRVHRQNQWNLPVNAKLKEKLWLPVLCHLRNFSNSSSAEAETRCRAHEVVCKLGNRGLISIYDSQWGKSSHWRVICLLKQCTSD